MRRRLPYLFPIGLACLLALVHHAWALEWLENAGRDGWYTDDVRNLIGFFAYADPGSFDWSEPVGRYSRAQSPFAHRALIALAATLGGLREITQWGPPVVWVMTAGLAARAGHGLARWPGAFLAASFVLVTPVYPERISGLLSRAFCFGGVYLFADGLIRLKPRRAGLAVVGLAALYPTVGALLGMGFAAWLLAFPRSTERSSPLRARLRTVALTGGLAVAMLVPTLVGLSEFGATTSNVDWPSYPEAGPGGTLGPGDRYPWRGLFEEIGAQQDKLLSKVPWWPVLPQRLGARLYLEVGILLALGGLFLRARRDERAERVIILGGIAVGGYIVARALYPHMYAPTRAITYIWPPFFHLALVAGLGEVAHRLNQWAAERGPWSPERRRALSEVVCLGLGVLLLTGRGDARAGFVFQRSEAELTIERAAAALPPTSRIAGWPDDPMSNLAWVSGRQAFMTGEMHIPHHAGYLEALRPRLRAFFRAYLATDIAVLRRFARDYGVTHVLVDTRQLGPRAPRYMAPFGAEIAKLHKDARQRKSPFVLSRAPQAAIIAQRGPFRLVEIAKLPPAEPPNVRLDFLDPQGPPWFRLDPPEFRSPSAAPRPEP